MFIQFLYIEAVGNVVVNKSFCIKIVKFGLQIPVQGNFGTSVLPEKKLEKKHQTVVLCHGIVVSRLKIGHGHFRREYFQFGGQAVVKVVPGLGEPFFRQCDITFLYLDIFLASEKEIELFADIPFQLLSGILVGD